MSGAAITTSRLHRLLDQKYVGADNRQGEAYVCFHEVRNGTGFSRRERTIDALAMSLWPSRGLELIGHEVKATRSDWLRELREPDKADGFVEICDRFYLVTEPGVVEEGELPPTWGHLERKGSKLMCKAQAPKLDPKPLDRLMLAALMRVAGRKQKVTPEQIEDAVGAERERTEGLHAQDRELLERQLSDLRETVRRFQDEAGVQIASPGFRGYDAQTAGRAFRLVLEGKATDENLTMRMEQLAETADRIAEQARALLPGVEAAA